MRGAYEYENTKQAVEGRFIPTCVGHTYSCPQCTLQLFAVHPHVRGAYMQRCNQRQWVYRFIPTCVGHTMVKVTESADVRGSSPRAWGIRACVHNYPSSIIRFIPTCVGHTDFVILQFHDIFRFIPTCVGHTNKPHFNCASDSGSSPRAWGILTRFLSFANHRSLQPFFGDRHAFSCKSPAHSERSKAIPLRQLHRFQ